MKVEYLGYVVKVSQKDGLWFYTLDEGLPNFDGETEKEALEFAIASIHDDIVENYGSLDIARFILENQPIWAARAEELSEELENLDF